MFRLNRITVVIIALMAGLLASAAPALAAGISVSPGRGDTSTTFTVQASGFNKNEQVSLWVTLANRSSVALTQMKADSSGSLAYSFTPQSSWPAGEVIVVAHGQSSKREYSTKIIIGKASSASTSTSVTSTVGGTLVSDPGGLVVNYQGSGYQAGERVATWFQYPNELATSTAHALPDVYADGSGNVSFNFTLQPNWPYGGYDIAAQGAVSKHITYNTFSFFGKISDHRSYWWISGTGTITTSSWLGQYFNNTSLSGTPVLVRQDAAINFNWGTGSPDPSVNSDNFSVRWTSTGTVATGGNYTITATTDDGMRVWVDGNLVIDEWFDQTATTYTSTVYLGAGQHTLQVEYYEHLGDAVAIVQIVRD